jgi:signal transduction histidine kinase
MDRIDDTPAAPTPIASARPATPLHLVLVRELMQLLLVGTGIAVFLRLAFGGSFGITWVYSCCVAFWCSLLLDGGRRVLGRMLRGRGQDWPGWPAMAAWILVGTPLAYQLGVSTGNLLTGGNAVGLLHLVSHPRAVVAALAITLFVSAVLTAAGWQQARLEASERRALEARQGATEARLRLLQSQLEPHMLFNTLANLRALIAVDPPRAQAMLDRLNTFLRSTLEASRSTRHPLAAEFARLDDYLALMAVRMGPRLQVQLDLPPALRGVPVPPLLLQPLVENAVRHGLEPQVAGGRVEVGAAQDAGRLVLTVRDTGVGLPDGRVPAAQSRPDGGFGLEQVRERLATLHGGAARLVVEPAGDGEGGTVARIELPLPEVNAP